MADANMTGFSISSDKTIAVTFHALVPKETWKWESNTIMTMRFGHYRLGKWGRNVAILEEYRDLGDLGLVEMRCTLNFDIDLLKSEAPLAYKYLIYAPQGGQRPTSEAYEYLHNAPSHGNGYINRCLVIPRDNCKANGILIMVCIHEC
jgi:hypothetical protein